MMIVLTIVRNRGPLVSLGVGCKLGLVDKSAGQTREEILTAAAAAGCAVTGDQLARWHRAGLLPRPVRRSLGRGLGTVTIYPEGTADRIVTLWGMRSRHRNLSRAAFELWWDGFEVEAEVIRGVLLDKAATIDAEVAGMVQLGLTGGAPSAGFGSLLSRRLGPARRRKLNEAIQEAARESGAVPATMPQLAANIMPPSLDDLFERAIPFLMAALAGPSVADLVKQSSVEELCEARDELKLMLSSLAQWAEPMAWLFGKRGAVFRLLADMPTSLQPTDYPDIVCASLLLRRVVPVELRALLRTPPPQVLREVAAFKAVHDSVLGAETVITPMAVRALLRGKEASGRYLPSVRTFFREHEVEVRAVVDPDLIEGTKGSTSDALGGSTGE